MLKRPQPRTLTAEQFEVVHKAAQLQTGRNRVPQTVDEDSYPMFEVPVNQKVLVYVPKHVVVDKDGNESLRMDSGMFHNIRERGTFSRVRCTNGISGIEGFDGSCPLCNCMEDTWKLYNLQLAEAARTKGLDIDNEEHKSALKDDKSKLFGEMAIQPVERRYTFPIVVIETAEGKLSPLLVEGAVQGKVYWYQISEKSYIDKWKSVFEGFPDDSNHPGGKWFVLDYTYQSDTGKHTKMKSASSLKVVYKSFGSEYDATAEYFDQLTEPWTPQLASEVIYSNMWYANDDMEAMAEEIIQPTRNKINTFEFAKLSVAANHVGGVTSNPAMTPEEIAMQFSDGEEITGATPAIGVQPAGALPS